MRRRNLYFGCFMLLTVAVFQSPLRGLARLAYERDAYSHILLIPLISAFLILLDRRKIFAWVEYRLEAGTIAIMAGLAVFYAARARSASLGRTDELTLAALSLVVVWLGGFVGCYGLGALKAAAFPTLFLSLMIPTPDFLLNRVIYALQAGSAEVTCAVLRLAGAPVVKQGFLFSLPGFKIAVAHECSGIRSSLALLITSLLAGHFFLRSKWKRLSFSLMVIPVTIIKNGMRIAMISLLSVYVDRGFLTGKLHHYSGIPFSVVAVVMLLPLLWWLQQSENRRTSQQHEAASGVPETLTAR